MNQNIIYNKRMIKNKQKYWYRTYITECVLCGRDTKYRERVYDKKLRGIIYNQDACGKHFM